MDERTYCKRCRHKITKPTKNNRCPKCNSYTFVTGDITAVQSHIQCACGCQQFKTMSEGSALNQGINYVRYLECLNCKDISMEIQYIPKSKQVPYLKLIKPTLEVTINA